MPTDGEIRIVGNLSVEGPEPNRQIHVSSVADPDGNNVEAVCHTAPEG